MGSPDGFSRCWLSLAWSFFSCVPSAPYAGGSCSPRCTRHWLPHGSLFISQQHRSLWCTLSPGACLQVCQWSSFRMHGWTFPSQQPWTGQTPYCLFNLRPRRRSCCLPTSYGSALCYGGLALSTFLYALLWVRSCHWNRSVSFLCTCCFSRTGEGLPNLGDSLPTASALLSMLSAIPNDRPGGSLAVFPGTGVFICDPAPPPQQGEPAVTCWLYSPASLPPPPPKAFCTLVSTLAPGDPAVCTPLFEHHSLAAGLRRGIPLGSHVCVHLNASLLPTPFLDRTETLSFLAVQNGGGLGASQYFHSFEHSQTVRCSIWVW